MEFFVTPMPVIAFAGFIVITEHALLVYDKNAKRYLKGCIEREKGCGRRHKTSSANLFSARTIH